MVEVCAEIGKLKILLEARLYMDEFMVPIAPAIIPDTRPRSEPALERVKCRHHITVPEVPTQEAIPEEGG